MSWYLNILCKRYTIDKLVIEMNLTDIDQKIMEYLVDKGDYATGQELSQNFDVSTKTIYRRIKKLRETLGSTIIESDRSKGYRINFVKYLHILNDYYTPNNQQMSVESRRLSILFNLLTSSPSSISIARLSEEYYVSQSSIVNDLDIIEGKLATCELELIRSNYGTSIKGKEKDIRKELMHIINRLLTDMETPTLSALTSKNESIQYLTEEFDKEVVVKIKGIIDQAANYLGYSIDNPYYINLLTHLLILLNRNNMLSINENAYDIKNVENNKYETAEYIIKEMELKFNINIDKSEIDYVYTFLISTRDNTDSSHNKSLENVEIKSSTLVTSFVQDIIAGMKKILDIDFTDDEKLKKSLLQHVQPMLNRVKYNVIIVNPLIADIKEEFTKTFNSLKELIDELVIKYSLKNISDDEIGYLALYFQNSIEKALREYKILIVCSTGIGSSHFLKTRVSNNFPYFNIKDIISTNELKNYNLSEIDFILTTVNLPPTRAPHIVIGALLDKGDINIIKQFLKNKFGG